MGGHVLVLVACAAAIAAADWVDIQLGVVEQRPVVAQQVGAAAEAGGGGAEVRVAPVEPEEPLALGAQVCEAARGGAAALLAGGGARALALAAEAAARAGVPLLLLEPAPPAAHRDALAMHPHLDVLAQVCAALCEAKGWSRAALLHAGSARAAALLAPLPARLALLPRRLPPPNDYALLRNLLLLLKKSGLTNFIIWCSAEMGARVLDAAQRVGLLSERHSYIVLTFDLHTQPLAPYSHGGANITTLQLFDPDSEEIQAMMGAWRVAYERRLGESADGEEAALVAARVAGAPPSALVLAQDAARLAAGALRHLRLPRAAAADCRAGRAAFHADTLLNYLRSEEWNGSRVASGGGAAWEADGGRREVQLLVAELERGGRLRAVARWSPRGRLLWQRRDAVAAPQPTDSMANRTFNILIALNPPYVMRKESTYRLSGNDRYEGFCIELIERLASLRNFNYTFVRQEDDEYGKLDNVTHEWNGMLGRLMRDPDIDFAITDLTITAEREKAVDFTTPFMNLGIAILFHTPLSPEPDLFAFLSPFSNDVWLCLGFTYLGTSLLLYVVGRLCPDEWQNPYPCIEEPPALENQFTLGNALWFNLGAVLMQGSEIAPVAYGTRAVASLWWLFALVITSSYTANLATLLAKKSSTDLIHNVQELADNTVGIDYGAKEGGATYTFFQHSQNEIYQKMFKHMSTRDMPKDNKMGIDWVMKGNYAFLMESTTIEYTTQRNCDVTMVGSLLDSKGYGIAMKKNSTYRQELNLALLNLQEKGILRDMKNKWWNEKHGGGACNVAKEQKSEELRMANFLGLFLVLIVGCALGVVVSCCDLVWGALRRPREPALPLHARLAAELRFVFRFDHSEKPVRGPLSQSSSGSPSHSESQPREGDEGTPEGERLRSASPQSGEAAGPADRDEGPGGGGGGPRPRRRSSMHAASLRLARHATRRSTTPSRH